MIVSKICPMRTRLSRRQCLSLGAVALAGLWLPSRRAAAQSEPIVHTGADLTGWTMVVGDGLYVAPGEPPVTEADILTTHFGDRSELRANVQRRKIMVHNLMFKKFDDPTVLNYIHICAFDFRLPFIPTTGNQELNAQTLEGGIAIWDGAVTRLVHNVAFQWNLNPYSNFGTMRTWSARNGGYWQDVGHLAVDMAWHRVQLINDYGQRRSQITIDGVPYTSEHTVRTGPASWGSDISASLGAEIISIYPEGGVQRAMHMAEFRNWHWAWSPPAQLHTFLPIVMQGG